MTLESSNKFLESMFLWAVRQTKKFVVTGTKNGEINKGEGNKWYGPEHTVIDAPTEPWAEPKDYKPCFWAGYFNRTAYYIRDFIHQAPGAYLVGLEEELYNMFYTFVSNADEQTGWFAPWAFNFDNSVYYMDTPNYKNFVRELPAQFELVETAYMLYRWSGDKRYIEDDTIFAFVKNVMTKLPESLDGTVLKEKNGIPEGRGDIWNISATYNERGFNTAEAGDCIGAMYRAMLSYAKILQLRGDAEEAADQCDRAEKLREYFNNDWSVVEGSDMYAYAIDDSGKKYYEWKKIGSELYGGESLFFIPMKCITYPGERNNRLLDYIFEKETDEKTRGSNIESFTYLPDVFFPYHQNDRAWYWMKNILSQKDIPHEKKSQGLNGDYPEISFTIVSQTVEGLMGVYANAAAAEISTCPHLPKDIDDISISDLKFGDNLVDIALEKNKAVVTNKGTAPLNYKCRFGADSDIFYVNDSEVKSLKETENGVNISYINTVIAPGETTVIKLK